MNRYELVDKPQKAVHNFPGVVDRSRKEATVEARADPESDVAVEKPKKTRKTATEKPKAVPFAKGKVI